MLETYHRIFDVYLMACTKDYNPDRPYDGIKERVRMCSHLRWKLHGMLELLHNAGCITDEQEQIEDERISRTFSAVRLFGAYEEDGEIMAFARKMPMPEDPHEF